MSNRRPMYFDTLKKDSLYLLTPKLGNPTGDKTLLSPMYFPRNILEENILTPKSVEREGFLQTSSVAKSGFEQQLDEVVRDAARKQIQYEEDEPA
jgi:hypothetical protein